jgi:hypothetical protein
VGVGWMYSGGDNGLLEGMVGLVVGDHVAPSNVGPTVGLSVTTVGVFVGRRVVGGVGGRVGPAVCGVGFVGLLVGLHVVPGKVGPSEGAEVILVGVCVGACDFLEGDFVGVSVGLV